RALARPKRLKQAKRECSQASYFQSETNPSQPARGGRAIAPQQQDQRNPHDAARKPEPVPAGEDERRQEHRSILAANPRVDNPAVAETTESAVIKETNLTQAERTESNPLRREGSAQPGWCLETGDRR